MEAPPTAPAAPEPEPCVAPPAGGATPRLRRRRAPASRRSPATPLLRSPRRRYRRSPCCRRARSPREAPSRQSSCPRCRFRRQSRSPAQRPARWSPSRSRLGSSRSKAGQPRWRAPCRAGTPASRRRPSCRPYPPRRRACRRWYAAVAPPAAVPVEPAAPPAPGCAVGSWCPRSRVGKEASDRAFACDRRCERMRIGMSRGHVLERRPKRVRRSRERCARAGRAPGSGDEEARGEAGDDAEERAGARRRAGSARRGRRARARSRPRAAARAARGRTARRRTRPRRRTPPPCGRTGTRSGRGSAASASNPAIDTSGRARVRLRFSACERRRREERGGAEPQAEVPAVLRARGEAGRARRPSSSSRRPCA